GNPDTFWVVWFAPGSSVSSFADSHVVSADTTVSDSHSVNAAGTWTIKTCTASDYNTANGNKVYNEPTFTTFSVVKANQTISFGALGSSTFGDADFMVNATGGASGNAVTFTASGQCTVSGNTVHITGAGSCTITAHQAGNSNYNAAPDVSQSFTINRA